MKTILICQVRYHLTTNRKQETVSRDNLIMRVVVLPQVGMSQGVFNRYAVVVVECQHLVQQVQS